jgi:copper transport protein
MRTRHLPRLVAGLVLAGVFLVATASPAWAHATLDSSSPSNGSTVTRAPSQIVLNFSEHVELPLESIRLLNCSGQKINIGTPHHGSKPSQVVVGNIPNLPADTYLILWRVISADSHPVQGGIPFQVGAGAVGGAASCKASLTSESTSSTTVGVLFGASRFLLFTGLALLIGGVAFLLLIARGTSAAPRARLIAWIGFFIAVFATIAGVMLQGPYAAGAGIGDAVKWSVISEILKTRYGHIALIRLGLLGFAFVLLVLLARLPTNRRPALGWWVAAALVGLGLAATPGLAGHADTGTWTWIAVPADTVHVGAMSVWLGGLVVLIATALGGGFSGGLRRTLIIFARLAFWCVVVLVVSGLFASWRQVGFSVSRYYDTTYGRLLLTKVGIVIVLVALAAVSRSIVRRRRAAPLDAPDSAIAAIDDKTSKGLRRSVGGEVLFGIGVLAVTALLVNAQPARTAQAAQSKVFSTTLKGGQGTESILVNITVDPAKVGVNTMHVYTLTPQGLNLTIRNISATFSQGSTSLNAQLHRGGANHFLSSNVVLPNAGNWQLVVHVIRGEFGDTPVSTTVPIK